MPGEGLPPPIASPTAQASTVQPDCRTPIWRRGARNRSRRDTRPSSGSSRGNAWTALKWLRATACQALQSRLRTGRARFDMSIVTATRGNPFSTSVKNSCSWANRRKRFIKAKFRSTTQRRGNSTKPRLPPGPPVPVRQSGAVAAAGRDDVRRLRRAQRVDGEVHTAARAGLIQPARSPLLGVLSSMRLSRMMAAGGPPVTFTAVIPNTGTPIRFAGGEGEAGVLMLQHDMGAQQIEQVLNLRGAVLSATIFQDTHTLTFA